MLHIDLTASLIHMMPSHFTHRVAPVQPDCTNKPFRYRISFDFAHNLLSVIREVPFSKLPELRPSESMGLADPVRSDVRRPTHSYEANFLAGNRFSN